MASNIPSNIQGITYDANKDYVEFWGIGIASEIPLMETLPGIEKIERRSANIVWVWSDNETSLYKIRIGDYEHGEPN